MAFHEIWQIHPTTINNHPVMIYDWTRSGEFSGYINEKVNLCSENSCSCAVVNTPKQELGWNSEVLVEFADIVRGGADSFGVAIQGLWSSHFVSHHENILGQTMARWCDCVFVGSRMWWVQTDYLLHDIRNAQCNVFLIGNCW